MIVIEVRHVDGLAVPMLAGTDLSVGQVIHACHERMIDEGLAELAVPGLDRASLEPVLSYCAKLECEPQTASCPGCARRSNVMGDDSLDDFVARHREIVVGDGKVRLSGQGELTLATPDLDTLNKTWQGENYWFWARRVIRKLRHGLRRAGKTVDAFAAEGESPSIVLVEPQLADNIGMVARAMGNFGLDDLRVVSPRDGWPNEKARVAAAGANYIIDATEAHGDVIGAIGDLNWVCATTARQRSLLKPVLTPAQATSEMVRRIARGERCGVLFGRESSGLDSSEVAAADALVMIPVNSRFASLNLAQAVLILGYSWMLTRDDQSLGRKTDLESPIETGLNLRKDRPATKAELVGFFEHLEKELAEQGFFYPPERGDGVVHSIRTMFARLQPSRQEVSTLRGIVATLSRSKGRAHK